MSSLRIDAHHHLWHYEPSEFEWLDDRMAALRRSFDVSDLEHAMVSAKVDLSVAVQTRCSVDESRFLLHCAGKTDRIRGVVGWVPLFEEAGLETALDELCADDRFVGVREITQGKPAGFLEQAALQRGIARLTQRDLTYDILIYAEQLEEATRLVDAHPQQRFVLDHCAKPKIANAQVEPWSRDLRELARRPNVVCKLSGLVTEADWDAWTLDALRPYLDVCVESFGPSRLMAGSDWPVCLTATNYGRWWSTLEEYFQRFSLDERDRIFGRTAVSTYRLYADEATGGLN